MHFVAKKPTIKSTFLTCLCVAACCAVGWSRLEFFSHFSSDFIRCLFENSIRSDGKRRNKTRQIEKKEFLCLNCPRKYLLEVAEALNTLIVDIKSRIPVIASITLIAFGKEQWDRYRLTRVSAENQFNDFICCAFGRPSAAIEVWG